MEVIHESQGDVDVFRISGRLDYSATAGGLEKLLRAPWEADQRRRFPVLDLSGVTMLGSQALRAVLALAKDIKGQSGIVYICAPSAAAAEALRISGFLDSRIFESHETMKNAVDAATRAAQRAPALIVDDPWQAPPEKPPEPAPPKGWARAADNAKAAAKGMARTWIWMAEKIQRILDKKK